eukprot:4014014-Prymnesium_polylepis.2
MPTESPTPSSSLRRTETAGRVGNVASPGWARRHAAEKRRRTRWICRLLAANNSSGASMRTRSSRRNGGASTRSSRHPSGGRMTSGSACTRFLNEAAASTS